MTHFFASLEQFVDNLLPPPTTDGNPDAAAENSVRLATAVVLVEVMRADASFRPGEREAVRDALHRIFDLSEADAERLESMAESTAAQATDYFAFTSRINERFGMGDKLRIVEQMWRVAYVDGVLSEHERHVLWRIADLLHVPQGAYVNARLRAKQAAGGGS